MNSPLFIAIVCIPFLFSCSGGAEESQNAEQQKLWDEMMAIHDEIMPAMGEIFKYSKELQTHLDSTEVETALQSEIEATIEQLNQADDGMMDWMAALKQPSELKESMNHKEIMEYLKTEHEKIEVVKQQMEESIENGKKMVEKITTVEVSQ